MFFFNDTATTEIYTLSLHDALPILATVPSLLGWGKQRIRGRVDELLELVGLDPDEYRDRYPAELSGGQQDRKSTRLNSSHANISYAVFCLKKKKSSHGLCSLPLSLP